MTESKISSRYASSFLRNSIEKNTLDRAASDMQYIISVFHSSRDLQLAMENPVIKSEIKGNVLSEIFAGKVDDETMSFIRFIVSKRRESLLQSIAKRFLEMYDEHLGIVRASVLSAFELSSEQKVQIKEKFEKLLARKVIINYQINEELLGGFVARIGDTIYDVSVKHQLNQLKKHFVKGSLSLN